MEEGLHIALKAGNLFTVGGFVVTNTLLTTWVVVFLLSIAGFLIGSNLRMVPGKIQLVLESVFGFVFSYIEETLESRELAKRYFPLIMTIFLFILCANWFGLLPLIGSVGFFEYHHGEETHFTSLFYPVNTDLNVTLALAIVAFFAIEIAGIAALGALKYGQKFVNFSGGIAFFVGLMEVISEAARLISFSFRLFGNIFAGKVLILVIMLFAPLIVPVPLLLYEVFVGFIQAVIFALLTLFFIKSAITEPAHH